MTEQYWEGSICGRKTKIDCRYNVYRMAVLIREFIQEHTKNEGAIGMSPDVFEGNLEAHICSTYPMVNVMAEYGNRLFDLTIDYNDINYHVDVSNKVFDVLRGNSCV